MADSIKVVTVQIPQKIQTAIVKVPAAIRSVTVQTGIRGQKGDKGDKGEPGDTVVGSVDTTARAAASEAQSSATAATYSSELLLSTSPEWGLRLQAHPGNSSMFDIGQGVANFCNKYTDPGSATRTRMEFLSGISGIVPQWGDGGRHPVYVSLSSSGDVVQSTSPPTLYDYTRYAYLGIVVVIPDTQAIAAIYPYASYGVDLLARFEQLCICLKAFNVSGNVYGPSASEVQTLKLSRTAGKMFRLGGNSAVDIHVPDVTVTNVVDPESFLRVSHQGGVWHYESSVTGNVDPERYDNLSDLVSMTAGYFQIKAVFFSPTTVFIQYGQAQYSTMAEAFAHLNDSFAIHPIISGDFVLRCLLIVQQGCTDLNDASKASFRDSGRPGVAGSGGGGTGGGEANTASNINERGTGIFIGKVGVDLQFSGVDSSDPLLTVGFDTPTKTILLGTNIYTGTGDPPAGLPNGSLYFKITP